MHILVAAMIAASNSTNSTKASAGSSIGSLLFILVIGLAAYVFFIRPRSQAARKQRETLQEVGPGDEVLTAAGIFGTVLDTAPDRVTIETAPGTRITVLRSTIARRISPVEEQGVPESWHDEEREGVAWHDETGETGEGHDGGEDHEDGDGHDGPRSGPHGRDDEQGSGAGGSGSDA